MRRLGLWRLNRIGGGRSLGVQAVGRRLLIAPLGGRVIQTGMRAILANLLSVWWRTVITLNPLFHWQYSGVAIPLLWGTAIAMVGLGIAFDAPDEIGTFFLSPICFL